MNRMKYLQLALVICPLFLPAAARAQRAIPDDNLAYPVLIQLPDMKASGFFLNTANSVYLVTAKHVLFTAPSGNPPKPQLRGPMTLLSYPRDPKETGTNLIQLDTAALFQAGEVTAHLTADVVVVRIAAIVEGTGEGSSGQHPGDRKIAFLGGVTSVSVSSSGILGVAMEAIKKYDDVLVANDVLLFGYPTSLGIQESPQLDPQRPLLRRGIVAGVNPMRRSIIVDCPSYPGNSGGPVVEADREVFRTKFDVIGVVSEFVPFEEKSISFPIRYENVNISNSGYTIVTPMDFVLELVK
jgi:hypothetical protein